MAEANMDGEHLPSSSHNLGQNRPPAPPTSSRILKPAPCRDFLLDRCSRNNCRYIHKYLKCTGRTCRGSDRCLMLHLNSDEMLVVETGGQLNANISAELNRLAEVVYNAYPTSERDVICTKSITKTPRCGRSACRLCSENPVGFKPKKRKACCFGCQLPLIRTKAFLLEECCHPICDRCCDKTEVFEENGRIVYVCPNSTCAIASSLFELK